jgi:hypothetical protein
MFLVLSGKDTAAFYTSLFIKTFFSRKVHDLISFCLGIWQDFSVLRAKTYDNVTVVDKKKNYSCHFCPFLTPLFGTLRLHIRQNHLGGAEPERMASAGSQRRNRSLEGSLPAEAPDTGGRPTRSRSDESLLATPAQGGTSSARHSAAGPRWVQGSLPG